MADEVQELRDAGRPFEAARTLTQQIEANATHGRTLWRRHVLGARCLLLEAAREQREVPAALADLERLVDAARGLLDLPKGHLALLGARLAVIEVALRRDLSPDEIEESLAGVVEQYASVWEYQALASPSTDLPPDAEPALVRRLPDDRSREGFRRLAARFAWQHPGLLLAAETFAFLWQPGEDLPHDHAVHTWVLLADRSSLGGFPARLHVERDPRGCGVLYPHPLAGGYLWTRADFQVGLQNAWLAALRDCIPVCEHDFRWWLDLADPADEGLPRMARLEGRSAELAIAAAIRAALGRDVLDQHVVSTASLRDPAGGDLRLSTVGSVALKAGGVLHQLKDVSEILVAGGQQVALEGRAGTGGGDPPQAVRERLEVGSGGLVIIPCHTFDEAYEQLSHWTRITRHVNGRIVERAGTELKECDPYVRLPMSRRNDRASPRGEHDEDSGLPAAGEPGRQPGETPWERLSPDQLVEFCGGRLRLEAGDARSTDEAPRFAVLAESGMGKSTLLWDCLKAVTEGESQRVAVLVRDWSQIPWADTDGALRELVGRCLAGCFEEKRDADPRQETHDRCTWFRRLLRQGNVVLLLDAVDQTEEDFAFGPVAGFLASDEVRRCVAIVTGRDHVLSTRSNLFDEQTWQVLRLEGFQTEAHCQADLRGYLGDVADDLLIEPLRPAMPEPIWDEVNENRRRKQQWEDLLRVPLLARLLRVLARGGELHGLKNRESVYERAMTDLMEQGFRSLRRSRSHHALLDVEEAGETLQVLAWHSVSHDDFRGQVTDRSWRALHHKFRDQPWEELEQVDIITIHTVLERPTATRLSWRHLSFCEYFAGAHVAEMGADEQAAVARRHARNRQWNWVFRFALSRLEREGNRQGFDHLAACLVRYGNPFVLFDAIDQDKVEPEPRLNRLSRWLVHRSFGESDYGEARTEGDPRPAADAATLEIVEDLFRREHRDSRCLHPAWELVQAALGEEGSEQVDARAREIAQQISERFLAEFPAMCGNPSDPSYEVAQALSACFVRCPENSEHDRKPFQMGEGDEQHAVAVQPFRMMRCQVTNTQYELFDPQHAVFRGHYSREDDQPVIWVSWYMAEMFCTWLGSGYRLPTEAEWEYACRAGSTTQYCFGDSDAELGEYAWYDDNSARTTHPVGEKKANGWGLYDMHGNVLEWCWDWHGKYGEGPARDPVGPDAGSDRVRRGGNWTFDARHCRSALRNHFRPGHEPYSLGFRVSLVPAEQESDERSPKRRPEA